MGRLSDKISKISNVTGKQDIVLVFSGPVNVDSFVFSSSSSTSDLGDINGDGSVDSLDYSLLKTYILNNQTVIDKEAADINSDGYIDSIDFSELKAIILKK